MRLGGQHGWIQGTRGSEGDRERNKTRRKTRANIALTCSPEIVRERAGEAREAALVVAVVVAATAASAADVTAVVV